MRPNPDRPGVVSFDAACTFERARLRGFARRGSLGITVQVRRALAQPIPRSRHLTEVPAMTRFAADLLHPAPTAVRAVPDFGAVVPDTPIDELLAAARAIRD